MLDKDTLITVTNRNNGSTGYSIPELNGLRRKFECGETKQLPMDELRKLSYLPGGDYMLKNYLIMFNAEAVDELLGEVEPEYYYKDSDIQNLLLTGSLDQLDDCLTFAPEGVISTMKNIAVKIRLNDMNKRKMIFEKTGFDVDKAIRCNEFLDAVEPEKPTVKKRKAAVPGKSDMDPVEASEPVPAAPQRKASVPKYKVTSITE